MHPTAVIAGYRTAQKEALNFIKNNISSKVEALGKAHLLFGRAHESLFCSALFSSPSSILLLFLLVLCSFPVLFLVLFLLSSRSSRALFLFPVCCMLYVVLCAMFYVVVLGRSLICVMFR